MSYDEEGYGSAFCQCFQANKTERLPGQDTCPYPDVRSMGHTALRLCNSDHACWVISSEPGYSGGVVHRPLSGRAQYVREGEISHPTEIGTGLVRPEDRNTPIGQLPQSDEFRIAEGEPLLLDLVLFTGQDATFLVTVLVDYKQNMFRLDGQLGLLHEVGVEAGKELFIPIQVDINGAGAHDLTLVAFRDPTIKPA